MTEKLRKNICGLASLFALDSEGKSFNLFFFFLSKQ